MAASPASHFCEVSEEDLENLRSSAIPEKNKGATNYGTTNIFIENCPSSFEFCHLKDSKQQQQF